ncbi:MULTISPECIES: xanthine dehydrogenase family protein molybdopterin-binding subunit [Acidobacterium]|uniref:Oxidoreductase, aldehyde oxidase/xanthine dehydrogenase family n=1 Tax=Acidobacterium capsulatum (strain ATCC 51196 / DSM 11244 / BCRC 80197 / JCM 7670 / NBRC 15755 / NCIMB 13165 / 161) TaxID=240015 RepID=C1FAC3_ACIC5|nr:MULTISPECIES: xanthine dehydrogenase family protein molybdopterin-binding subunit [Acidobacterium]ACO31711.1 oxidoreductase, aldehyde oxidase/xanthine dehydrogenase family [Acidobacterium capsulatum ATCC 51196]HCT62356.1 xanthine dehydrogenase family protein molybdopterin-binding subunit [Acidobacterium sp.]
MATDLFNAPIGQPVTRIEGFHKVTGTAPYALDFLPDNVAHAVGVFSTIGKGRIASIDTSKAESMPGVLAVLHHGNIGPIYRSAERLQPNSHASESRPPLSDDRVYYFGQFVAVVVANTFEQATAAAAHVHVKYDVEKPATMPSEAPMPAGNARAQYARGDAASAFSSAPVQIEGFYSTPTEMHNPMEMHATTAVWKGDKVTLYETTQGVMNHQGVSSEMLGIPIDRVEVICYFCGGGFGGKLFPWPQSALAAVAARQLGRPVKIFVPRDMMFTTVGHRPTTQQHLRVGATHDGKLLSIEHNVVQPTSMLDSFMEYCIGVTGMLYSCKNIATKQDVIPLNIGTPTPMRGPGTTPGLYALESAMDDLAIKLNMDPLELRLKNYAEIDESSNKPYSGKHLRECYQAGAEKFGWSKRDPRVGSMRNGSEILGWGMATSTWEAGRGSADVRVRLMEDGRVRVSSGTQDPGTGTYTVMAQVAAERLGIPMHRIHVVIGKSNLPPGPMSGGSTATASVIPAVAKACDEAMNAVLRAADNAPDLGIHDPESATGNVNHSKPILKMTNGYVHAADAKPETGKPFGDVLQALNLAALEGEASTHPNPEMRKYSGHCFGAQFVEVGWDPGIARLRVNRIVTVMDVGRVINKKTARNQVLGGVTWGIGMGAFEETIYDPRNAKPLNNNFADYLVPTNADVPKTEVIFVEYPDYHLNEFGARGVGEIGLTGVASALTMAVYHATGIRVRRLPIRIEDLLPSKVGLAKDYV